MTQLPIPTWTKAASTADFTDPARLAHYTTRFERSIRRRNAIEYAAGALVVAAFSLAGAQAAIFGLWPFALALWLTVAGTLYVIWKLRRDGSVEPAPSELPCREHLRSQLERQRRLLRAVPRWYLAPLAPGIVGIYGLVIAGVARNHGLMVALEGVWLPLVATAGFFGFVAWLNFAAAKRIERQIHALDRLG